MISDSSLIIKPQAGLANRLMALFSSIRIAKMASRDLLVNWGRDSHCNARLEDVLETPFRQIMASQIPDNVVSMDMRTRLVEVDGRRKYITPNEPIVDIGSFPISSPIVISSTKIVSESGDVRRGKSLVYEAWMSEIQKLTKDMRFNSKAVRRVDGLIKAPLVVAMHIRRPYEFGNFISEEKFLFPQDEAYFEVAEMILENRRGQGNLFLATNHVTVLEKARSRFGSTLVGVGEQNYDNSSGAGAIIDAIVDLLSLSRAPIIIRSAASTYGYLSSIIGRSSQVILDQRAANERLRFGYWDFNPDTNAQESYYPSRIFDDQVEFFRYLRDLL